MSTLKTDTDYAKMGNLQARNGLFNGGIKKISKIISYG
jgi:hypothetical protein